MLAKISFLAFSIVISKGKGRGKRQVKYICRYTMTVQETYMHRCLQLAKLGAGNVAPNPIVGAILVYDERIIGEGYHQQYGAAHAEVNCIASVKENEKELIPGSTMYVSLEPCVHFGKTPPCADLIIKNKIKNVVIGCRDPFEEVNGKGIEKLQAAGVNVTQNILEKDCKELNKRFFTFQTIHRPYIILKWAQTINGKIAGTSPERLLITNEFTNRLAHKWRSEEAAILVGTNTALMDDPELITRLWIGNNPIRLVVDMDLKLSSSSKIFNQKARTIVFNNSIHEERDNVSFYQVTEDVNLVHQIVNALYQLKIQSVIIEGGAKMLQSFIDEELWDEARVITNNELIIDRGLDAPKLFFFSKIGQQKILNDQIDFFKYEPGK
ncbi:MAG TPA: bifunctional diaminohydroxyphosphoribosylaminopyrimidine deaminase/5-amino-6-(5-phosphoribosylamino)uracil reductase RibD [Chitinophagaceae bacterium]